MLCKLLAVKEISPVPHRVYTIPRTGPVPPGLLVAALPCGEYETMSHPGDFQSEPTWFARFCAWLMLVVVACWVVLLNCILVALVGSPLGSPEEPIWGADIHIGKVDW